MTRPFHRYHNFIHMTLTVTFNLYLKNFNIVHNYSNVGDGAFIVHMGQIYMYSSWQDLSVRIKIFDLGTLTFNLHFKNFNLPHWRLLFIFCCRLVSFVVFWQLFLWYVITKHISTYNRDFILHTHTEWRRKNIYLGVRGQGHCHICPHTSLWCND